MTRHIGHTPSFRCMLAPHLLQSLNHGLPQIFITFVFVGVISCWFLLATALDPTIFLPYGVAAVTCVTIATTMMRDLLAAAGRVRTALENAFNFMLSVRLNQAQEKLNAQAGQPSEPGRDVLEQGLSSSAPESQDGADEEEGLKPNDASPERIFAMLNAYGDGDGELTKEEFASMFKLLDLKLSEAQQEQLFALCDVDCNGTVSEEEFVRGWSLMVETFTNDGAEALGLGQVQIVVTVASIVTMLGLIIAFILVTLAAWANEDSFGALVQSALVAGSGSASKAGRTQSDVEDPEKGDEMARALIDQQAEGDAEG